LSIIGCALSLIYTTGIGSYLVGVVDGFITKFAFLLLLAIQCIIFGWLYDLDSLISVLNENSKFNVGKAWKAIIRYILPIFLIVMWILGVYDLFMNSNSFEITVYCIITAIVLAVSVIFTNIESKDHD
jgi:NSS family neurotransmitter:Na+ symporter